MVSALPEGPDWSYEIKLDGYRAQALSDGTNTQLLSRNGKDLGKRFPAVLAALSKAIPSGSILDGELVALDASGKPSFGLIQNSATSGASFVFFAFDLLQLAGTDLTRKPLVERQGHLRKALKEDNTVQLSQGFRIPAKQMLEMVRSHGLEGVVAKKLSSLYEPGRRSGAWSKMRVETVPRAGDRRIHTRNARHRCRVDWFLQRARSLLLWKCSQRLCSCKPKNSTRRNCPAQEPHLPFRESS